MESKNPSFRIAVSASFTAEPLEPVLLFWGRHLNADFEVRFAPYNQLSQTLFDPQSIFATNSHGVNVMLARLEDFAHFENLDAKVFERIHHNVIHFVQALRDSHTSFAAPVIFCLSASSPEFRAREPEGYEANLINVIESSLGDLPGVQFLDYEQIHALYPAGDWHDASGAKLAKIPYTELYYTALGTALVRETFAMISPPRKVIALDCDNTLWQGICGEDGPSGIVLDEPRRRLQEFMLEQREEGMLLCLASKNNPEDVRETFRRNPRMPLQLRHFVACRLNWESKAANLASLAEELNLGVDSFIFLDDNPRECAEVEGSLPEVAALTLPENITETPHFLQHVWAFDHPVITEEDRNRNAFYTQAQEFGKEARAASDLQSFIEGLELRVTVNNLSTEKLGRAAQLTQRTNQFNFTTVRRSESELQGLVARQSVECLTVEVSDRFGEHGVVGLVIAEEQVDALNIDTFLLSCRVLGRGVEHRVLAEVSERARVRGLRFITANLVPSAKNEPARQFLESVGARYRSGEFTFRFPVDALPNLTWTPDRDALLGTTAKKPKKAAPQRQRQIDFEQIARTLASPEQILAAIKREAQSNHAVNGAAVAVMTDTERQLAALWSELLRTPNILPDANFFDLGGHSLLAVQLLLRVKEKFAVELSIDDVYSGTLTLADLARNIEDWQIGRLDPAEYQALLAEIENLSDEQAQEMLAREDSAAG